MNNKVTIRPNDIIKCDFKHLFSYKLLFHIMSHFNTELNIVFIDKADIILRYNSNGHTVNKAIDELIDKHIIIPLNYSKFQYKVNNNIFIKFK